MSSRKLQFEPLERRELLAGWPQGVGTTDVLWDGGAKLSHYVKSYALDANDIEHIDLRTSSATKTRAAIIGSDADTNGWMRYPDGQWSVLAAYVNGGSATGHGKVLGDAGQQVFREFWEAGGGLAGSCAGLWILRTGRNYFDVWDGTVKNSGHSGTQKVDFSGFDGPFAEYLDRFDVPDVVSKIRHIGGPKVDADWNNPEGTIFYGQVISGVARGTNYVMTYQTPTSGPALGFPGHPEYASSGDRMNLFGAGITYVVERSRIEPKVVGDLTAGTTSYVIGAGQYIRYRMTVPPGLAQITLATSAPSGTEIFVTFNGAAYDGGADYSGDSLAITAPEGGKWEVSVLGTHEVANGVPYALTLEAYRDDPIRWTTFQPEAESTLELLVQQVEASPVPDALPVATIQPKATAVELARRSVFASWSPFDDYLELAT
jgi:hypothetical protein